jgi:hypothetical protein
MALAVCGSEGEFSVWPLIARVTGKVLGRIGPSWARLGLPVLFPTYSSGSKQLHPLAVEAALHFSPLGYHTKQEISA